MFTDLCFTKTQIRVLPKHKEQNFKDKVTPKIVRAGKHKCGFCQNTNAWFFRRLCVLYHEIPPSDVVEVQCQQYLLTVNLNNRRVIESRWQAITRARQAVCGGGIVGRSDGRGLVCVHVGLDIVVLV